jgi:hypothetical protein
MARDARGHDNQQAEGNDRDHHDDRNRALRDEPESSSLRERLLEFDLVCSKGRSVTRGQRRLLSRRDRSGTGCRRPLPRRAPAYQR